MNIKRMVERLIELRQEGIKITLLAVCPTSEAVLEAAVIAAKRHNTPMLLAATLNQVDRDGGYTGWTPDDLVRRVKHYTEKHRLDREMILPCLDHGGPWMKDTHVLEGLNFEATWYETQQSITAALKAGYQLLHIDCTSNLDQPIHVDLIVQRTLALIEYAESERQRLELPPIAYEVGTDEIQGELTDPAVVQEFLQKLHQGLADRHLHEAQIAFLVADIGTRLHTDDFDEATAKRLFETASPYGILAKGHYTDEVAHPEAYPECGIGGANVGPELTAVEVEALFDLAEQESELLKHNPYLVSSNFVDVLTQAVARSNRWQKWRLPHETGKPLRELAPQRREWILKTSARYVLANAEVAAARQRLYNNLRPVVDDPHQVVVERVGKLIERYVVAFNLVNSRQYFVDK